MSAVGIVNIVALCIALFGLAVTPALGLDAAVTENNPRIFVAPLPAVLNTRTLTDYDVKRFFTQFGADPNGVWSNPIGNYVGERDDMELRNTYMYGLDVIFHRQLLQSPLRVHTSAEADVVFLPIYADIGCRLSQENDSDAKAWREAIDDFWSSFNRTYPDAHQKPHFVVSGRREAENMGGCGVDGKLYNGKVDACNFLCHPLAKNLLVLTVEAYSGSLDQMSPKPLRPNTVVVPWPGHWHLHLGSRYFNAPFDRQGHAAARQYLAMESLKVRLPLREQLYKSCSERSDQCLHYAPRGRISQFNQSEIYDVIKSAWYCIQPPGDGPSRHATMDCFAADTMPVFFDKHLTAVMPFSDVLDYADFTEYMDPEELQSSAANAIDVLQGSFTKEAALKKAQKLHEIKHVFLYALNPSHSLIRWHEAYAIHPLDDAFTSSMKALLRRSCELGLLGQCEKAEAGKAAARGTAKSAAPNGLLQPKGSKAASHSDAKSGTSDQKAQSSDSNAQQNTAAQSGSQADSSDSDKKGSALQSDNKSNVAGQKSDSSDSDNKQDAAAKSDKARVSDSSSSSSSNISSGGDSGGADSDSRLQDTKSDSGGSKDVDAVVRLYESRSSNGGVQAAGEDAQAAKQSDPAAASSVKGGSEKVQRDVDQTSSSKSDPTLRLEYSPLPRKMDPGGKSLQNASHSSGSGDGSPAVKRGDSLKFANQDERDVAVAVSKDRRAVSESDQADADAEVLADAAERQVPGSRAHTTGGGDGSPALRRGDSLRYPNIDERDVAVVESRDANTAERDEEEQSLFKFDKAR